MPNKWSETVCAPPALCAQQPRTYTKVTMGKENPCLFFHSDDNLKLLPADRFHSFFSLGTLRIHINKRHLPITASREPVNCPYPACAPTLHHAAHLGTTWQLFMI